MSSKLRKKKTSQITDWRQLCNLCNIRKQRWMISSKQKCRRRGRDENHFFRSSLISVQRIECMMTVKVLEEASQQFVSIPTQFIYVDIYFFRLFFKFHFHTFVDRNSSKGIVGKETTELNYFYYGSRTPRIFNGYQSSAITSFGHIVREGQQNNACMTRHRIASSSLWKQLRHCWKIPATESSSKKNRSMRCFTLKTAVPSQKSEPISQGTQHGRFFSPLDDEIMKSYIK